MPEVSSSKKVDVVEVGKVLYENKEEIGAVFALFKRLLGLFKKNKSTPMPPSTPMRDRNVENTDEDKFTPVPTKNVSAVAKLDAHLGWFQYPQDMVTSYDQNLYPQDLKREIEAGRAAFNLNSKFKVSCTPRDAQGNELLPDAVRSQGLAHKVEYRFWVDGESGVFNWKNGQPNQDGSLTLISMGGRAYEDTLGYNPTFKTHPASGRHEFFVQPFLKLDNGTEVLGPKIGPFYGD